MGVLNFFPATHPVAPPWYPLCMSDISVKTYSIDHVVQRLVLPVASAIRALKRIESVIKSKSCSVRSGGVNKCRNAVYQGQIYMGQ